jgi:hydroxymethylpyrimidine/phosphomethylpyrimidine kinase
MWRRPPLDCLAEQGSAGSLLRVWKTVCRTWLATWIAGSGGPTWSVMAPLHQRYAQAHICYIGLMPPPVVLTIAGFDPSSGAGVTADIKTIAGHGCYGVGCITALTVQSTGGVRRVEAVSPELVTETLQELGADLAIAAVHIGMLGSGKVVRAVADFLEKAKFGNVVLDPIIKSSSGQDLIDAGGVRLLIEWLLPLATVITPNVDEAAALTGRAVSDLDQMRVAVARLHEMGAASIVITGGHLEKAIDLLSFASRTGPQQEVFKSAKLPSNSTHGTGCAFSTAMACHLALGRGLPEAVLLAKTYVAAAIANAYPLGRGVGPVHHLYRMYQQRRVASHEGQ